jgi:capsular exopolysaccharide synthesis family protein
MSEGNEAVLAGGGRAPKHLWDYWRILWEGRWKLIVVLGVTSLVAVAGTFFMGKRYRAEALLEVNLSTQMVLGSQFERFNSRSFFERDQAFNTEFEKIRSRRLVAQAIEEHDLLEKVPSLARAGDPVRILKRQLRAGRVPQTNAVKISVSWFDADTAALLANAIPETYRDEDLRASVNDIGERVKRLGELLGQREQERRSGLEYDLRKIRETTDIDTLFSLQTVADDESLSNLREEVRRLQRERDSLAARYGVGHPEMQRNKAELDAATVQLSEALKAHESWIVEELSNLGEGAEGAQGSFLSGQQREVQEQILEDLRGALSQQAMMAQTTESKIRIIDPAIAPLRPYSPRPMLNLALALVVGLGFGGGLLFFQEYLDVSVKTLEDVEQDLGLNLLAVIPKYTGQAGDEVKEAYQTLRTSVVFASEGRSNNLLLVTAAAPGEGKTRTVSQLARTLVATGSSVIVVDCDLRMPALAREFGVDGRQGLSNYLAGGQEEHWRSHVKQSRDGVDVLPPGPVPPNPLHLLGLDRFAALLAELKQAYDWVLLDSPPASSVSDAVVLADLADACLVVIRHDDTDRDVIRRAVQRLQGVGSRVVGAVLNSVDMSKSYNRDYYYGRFYYGSYYGDDGGGKSDSSAAGADPQA